MAVKQCHNLSSISRDPLLGLPKVRTVIKRCGFVEETGGSEYSFA